jgi:ParB family chromosome partitioning protein
VARIQEVREIPMKDLVIGKGQVRVRNVGRDIDELAESIRVHGLLEPIVVAPSGKPDKYEILTGQRRFLAHQKLGRDVIHAAVLDERVDEMTAKVLSLTENLIRRDLDSKDIIDACTALFKKYGTARAVAEETGLPYQKVLKYVKYDRLASELRDLVDSGEIPMEVALKAQDAASVTGDFDPVEGVQFARELSAMSGAQQRKLVQERREDPDKSVEDVIEDAKTGQKITQIIVTLGADEHRALQTYAREEDFGQDQAAATLIADGLSTAGYLEEDGE